MNTMVIPFLSLQWVVYWDTAQSARQYGSRFRQQLDAHLGRLTTLLCGLGVLMQDPVWYKLCWAGGAFKPAGPPFVSSGSCRVPQGASQCSDE